MTRKQEAGSEGFHNPSTPNQLHVPRHEPLDSRESVEPFVLQSLPQESQQSSNVPLPICVPADWADDIKNQLRELRADFVARFEKLEAAIASCASAEVLSQTLQTAQVALRSIQQPKETPTELVLPLIRDLIEWVSRLEEAIEERKDHPDFGTYKHVMHMLDRYGAQPWTPVLGAPFSPAECQASQFVQTQFQTEDGTIAKIERRGWTFNGTRLFYPRVVVKRFSANNL